MTIQITEHKAGEYQKLFLYGLVKDQYPAMVHEIDFRCMKITWDNEFLYLYGRVLSFEGTVKDASKNKITYSPNKHPDLFYVALPIDGREPNNYYNKVHLAFASYLITKFKKDVAYTGTIKFRNGPNEEISKWYDTKKDEDVRLLQKSIQLDLVDDDPNVEDDLPEFGLTDAATVESDSKKKGGSKNWKSQVEEMKEVVEYWKSELEKEGAEFSGNWSLADIHPGRWISENPTENDKRCIRICEMMQDLLKGSK